MTIILEDFKNKKFQIFRGLSEEKELHIRGNVIKLNEIDVQYTVCFWNEKDDCRLKKSGFINDLALYDKAIMNYNITSGKERLVFWIR